MSSRLQVPKAICSARIFLIQPREPLGARCDAPSARLDLGRGIGHPCGKSYAQVASHHDRWNRSTSDHQECEQNHCRRRGRGRHSRCTWVAEVDLCGPTNSVAEAAVNAPKHYGFSKKTGMEGLLSIDGTLFIGNNPMRHGRAAAKFREAGVDAAVVNDRQPIGGKIRAVATFLGDPKAGDKLAGAVERQLAEAAAITRARQGHRLRILAVTASGAGGANAVMGMGTASAEMIAACGATSVGVRAGLRGYSVKFTDEGLLSMKPDVILTGDGDLKRWGGLEGYLKAFPTLAQTPAGRKNHVFVMPSEQIKVSGVGVGAGAIALARALDALSR